MRVMRSGAGWSATCTMVPSSGCSPSVWPSNLRSHVTDRQGGVLLRETEGELQEALADLRELARGIHPAVLTD